MGKCLCEQLAGKMMEISEVCIGGLWIFKDLKPDELKAVLANAIRKIYHKGETIFVQGETADKMFLIKAGRVKLSKVTEDGSEITLDIRKSGDILGETMFSEEADYPMTAWCMESTLICGLTKLNFEKTVLHYPDIGLRVIRNLSERISRLTERVDSMSASSLEERLYRVLVNVAKEHGESEPKGMAIHFPLTHEDLGFLVGAHRVSITRAMKALKNSGRILQEGRTLILTGNGIL